MGLLAVAVLIFQTWLRRRRWVWVLAPHCILQSPGLLGACDMPALFLLICDVLDLPWPPMHCAFPVSPVGTAGGSPSVPMLHFRGEGADVEKGSMVPGHPLKAGLGLEPLFLGLPAHVHI